MVRVIVGSQESLDRAIVRFKRKCDRAGILRDFRKSTYYLKPSQRRRLRRENAIRRANRLRVK